MKHSIRNRIAVAIVALLLFVLGTSFRMNNVFLEKYYMVQKERSLIKVYTLIPTRRTISRAIWNFSATAITSAWSSATRR